MRVARVYGRAFGAACIGLAMLCANPASAQHNDSWASELGHFAGGIAVGGGVTALANLYWPENRVLIGFGVGLTYSVLGEALSSNGFSTLDFFSNLAGVTVGVLLTDKWILRPVAKHQADGSSAYGVVAQRSF